MKKNTLHKSDMIALLLENAVSIVLTLFVIFMIFYRPSFHSWANITAIINDCCMYGITALGMTTVILCGEIDPLTSETFSVQLLHVGSQTSRATERNTESLHISLLNGR